MNQVAFYIKIYKWAIARGYIRHICWSVSFQKFFSYCFIHNWIKKLISFIYLKVKNQILLIKTFCIFTKVYPVRCCIFFNLDEKNSMERLRTECFFGKITQKERIIKRMAEAKGTFLRPFNKLACFPWDHYKQWSEEYLIISGKRRMTKLLGFIHRLKRTVKFHTSDFRNKLTDSNSSNGRAIINSTEMFCSIALFTWPFWRI